MKFPSNFSIRLRTNQVAPVKFILKFNNQEVDSAECLNTQDVYLSFDFDDTEFVSHNIELSMVGKTGNDDIHQFLATVTHVTLDYADITEFFSTVGLTYSHSGNGYLTEQKTHFYYSMGADGNVVFPFASPVYKWLSVITTPNYGY